MGEFPYHTEMKSWNLVMSRPKNTGMSNLLDNLKNLPLTFSFQSSVKRLLDLLKLAYHARSVQDSSGRADRMTPIVVRGLTSTSICFRSQLVKHHLGYKMNNKRTVRPK